MALVEMAQKVQQESCPNMNGGRMEVPEAFVEVIVRSNERPCSLVGRRQRVLYKNVMQENSVVSHGGFPISAAELLTRLERGEEAWVPDLHSSEESADEGPVKPTLKRLPKGGMWWGRYRSSVTYPSSDSSNSDDELESEAEEEKPQHGGQRLIVFHRSLLASSRGNLKQKDSCKNGAQLKKHPRIQIGFGGESAIKERTTAGDCRNTCADCGQSFKSKLSLSNHQRKHTREKPYLCSRCGEKFTAKKTLAAHQMSHAEEKGYKHPSSMKITTKLQMVHPQERPYKCTQCAKSFTVKDHLVQHEKIHSKERPYTCPSCGKGFIRKEHLNRHKMIHRRQENDPSLKTAKVARVESPTVAPKKKSSIDPERTVALNTRHQRFSVNRFKCQFCGRCMRAKALLVDHERSHREERHYKCAQCNKSFYQKHYFEKHKKIHLRRQPDGRPSKRVKQVSEKSSPSDSGKFHIEEDPSKSPVGRKIITRSFHLTRRLKLLTKKKVFKCQYCGKCMSSSSSLIKHESIHRGERPYKCQDCGKNFHKKCHLVRHSLTHSSRKPLKHNKNVKRINVKRSFRVLRKISTGQKCYKGLIREYIVTRSSRFAKQPTINTEKKLYKCQFCGKVLRTKNSLLVHERTHKGAKQYACLECGKQFSQKNYLGCHQRSHMRKKPYKCSDSDKSLTTKNASCRCKSPQKRELRYTCLKCGKSFDEKYYLRRHHIIHTGAKPIKCVTCGKGFIQNWHLRRHEKTHQKAGNHKQSAEPEESQLFFSAENGISSEKKDQKNPPVNVSGQMTSRTEEKNTSPNLKMAKTELLAAFKESERGSSHGPEQGEIPPEEEREALLSRKNKTKQQIHKEAEVSTGRLLQPRRGQARKDNALLHNKLTENDLGQQVQPTKCSKQTSHHRLKNEKVHADWPLRLQANSVRKSQRETHLTGKQCRSCFCQQEKPGVAAPGRKPRNSQTSTKTENYISSQREVQTNVSSNMSKRALKSCKSRKAWLDQRSQPLFSESRMEANQNPIGVISACVEQQEVLGKKVGGNLGNLVSPSCMTVKSEAVNISEHQTLPRFTKSDTRNSCQQIQAANKLKNSAVQNSGVASANWQVDEELTSLQTMEKNTPQQKVRVSDDQEERIIKREPKTMAAKKGVAVRQDKLEKLLSKHRCTKCKKSFRSQAILLIHKKHHTGNRPFQCTQCEKNFYDLSSLKVHMRVHTGEKPYKCTECPFRCSVSSKLSRHKQTHGQQKPHACQLCTKRFWMNRSLQAHLKTHLDKLKSSVLQNLGVASANWQVSEQPTSLPTTENHTPQQKVRDSDDQEERTIKRNPKTNAPKKGVAVKQDKLEKLLSKHKCTKCKKSFRSKTILRIHKKNHTGNRPFQCTQCEKNFYELPTLKVHMRIHTGEKPYKCAECPFRCSVSWKLSKHKQTHGQQKPHACQLCNKCFRLNRSLQAHLKTHSDKLKSSVLQNSGVASANSQVNEQPTSLQTMEKHTPQQKVRVSDDPEEGIIKREPKTTAAKKDVAVRQDKLEKLLSKHRCRKCKKSFRSQAILLIHKKHHTGNRPFQCTQCEKNFYDLPALKVHMRIHTGEKPYKCTECPFRCSVSSNLSRHKRIHARPKPHACQLCTKRFWMNHSLQAHLQTHSGKEPHKCCDCGRVFTQENFLKLHRRFKHSSEAVE